MMNLSAVFTRCIFKLTHIFGDLWFNYQPDIYLQHPASSKMSRPLYQSLWPSGTNVHLYGPYGAMADIDWIEFMKGASQEGIPFAKDSSLYWLCLIGLTRLDMFKTCLNKALARRQRTTTATSPMSSLSVCWWCLCRCSSIQSICTKTLGHSRQDDQWVTQALLAGWKPFETLGFLQSTGLLWKFPAPNSRGPWDDHWWYILHNSSANVAWGIEQKPMSWV